MKVAVLSPVWFPVPPVRLRRDRVDRLAARGRARRRRPRRDAVRLGRLAHPREARGRVRDGAERADRPDVLGAPARAELLRAARGLRRHPRPHGADGPRARLAPADAARAHRPRAGGRPPRRSLRADRAHGPAREADLALAEPARAETEPAVDRERPERPRPLLLPVPAGAGRLPALPRPDEPGQGRAPGGDDRARGRAAAEDRGQVRRAGRAGVLRRARAPASRRRPRIRRRGVARREGRAAPARPRDRLPDLLAGAVRPRHDRVDGVRDAGDRDPLGRRARGDRGRADGDHRRRLAADGGRARGGGRARPGRAAEHRRGALHARAHGGRLRRRLRSSSSLG